MNDRQAFPRIACGQRVTKCRGLFRGDHLIENLQIVGDLLPYLRIGLLQLLCNCLKSSLVASDLALLLEGLFLLYFCLPLGFGGLEFGVQVRLRFAHAVSSRVGIFPRLL